MCEVDALGFVANARLAAELVLQGVLRLPVAKQLDLSTSAGFDRAVALLASKLRRAARGAEAAAVRAATSALDVDWKSTTASQRRSLVSAAMAAAQRETAAVPAHLELSSAAKAVVTASRESARRGGRLAIRADLNALDRRIAAHIATAQGLFVRDEYGRRIDSLGHVARQIVSDGLEQGLGRSDIANALRAAAQHELIDRAPFYWEIVAAAFTGRGRSFAQLSAFAEAGIRSYRIEAILDEATTNICRYLHGKTFFTSDAVRRFERVERLSRPEDIKRELPWVRQAPDAKSGRPLLHIHAGGRVDIAEVIESGMGTSDAVGEFQPRVSDDVLADLGISFPPFHGLCRTTIVAGPA